MSTRLRTYFTDSCSLADYLKTVKLAVLIYSLQFEAFKKFFESRFGKGAYKARKKTPRFHMKR